MWKSLLRGSTASGDSWKMDTGASTFCHNNWCVIKITHQSVETPKQLYLMFTFGRVTSSTMPDAGHSKSPWSPVYYHTLLILWYYFITTSNTNRVRTMKAIIGKIIYFVKNVQSIWCINQPAKIPCTDIQYVCPETKLTNWNKSKAIMKYRWSGTLSWK